MIELERAELQQIIDRAVRDNEKCIVVPDTHRTYSTPFTPFVVGLILGAVIVLGAMQARSDELPEPPSRVQGAIGVGASFSDDSSAILPAARIELDAPLYVGAKPLLRLSVALQLAALPGQELNVTDPATFASAEVVGELGRRIGRSPDGLGETMISVRGGWATRILPTDEQDRERYARQWGVMFRSQRRDADGNVTRAIAAGWGRADVVSPEFDKGQIIVDGKVRLVDLGWGAVELWADAYLSVSRTPTSGARDLMRVWVSLGK